MGFICIYLKTHCNEKQILSIVKKIILGTLLGALVSVAISPSITILNVLIGMRSVDNNSWFISSKRINKCNF